MKRFLAFTLCILLCLSMFAACGGGDGGGGGGGGAGDAGDEQTYLIRIASDETKDTPCSVSTFYFKDLIEEATDGKMTVEYFYDSAMGDEREIAESLNMGNLEMGMISGCLLATYDENWYLLDLPYVFPDRPTMYGHLDGAVGDYLTNGLMEKSKIECLDYADGSFKVLLNSVKPIKTVGDLSNLKIRSQESKMNMSIYKAWSSTAVPMGFSEIFTALQQGTVDGVDTSPLYQRSGGFYEVAKYLTMTNHQALSMVSLINYDFLNSLPEDLQKIVRDCSHKAFSVKEREIVEEAEDYALEVMEGEGCEIYYMTDAELKTFTDASKAVIEEYRSIIDPELYDLMGL
jgi:tripartite ATP-independent transporter DctP family solute receptor